jgi:hypothetical protein
MLDCLFGGVTSSYALVKLQTRMAAVSNLGRKA